MKLPINNHRWWIAGLVFLSTVINYIDRQTLSVLAPQLSKELGLSNIDYGWISQAFLIPYTAMYIVAGILLDRYGTKLIFGVAAAWWSLAAMLHATVSTAFGFGVFRFLLGTAESANFVAAQTTSLKVTEVREAAGDSLVIFGGLNGHFLIEELQRGARGTMPGSDLIPMFVRVWNLYEAGKLAEARAEFNRYLPLIRFELQPGLGVSAMKHNLKAAGVIKHTTVRPPTRSLDPIGREELEELGNKQD